jgi:hypothetical protein
LKTLLFCLKNGLAVNNLSDCENEPENDKISRLCLFEFEDEEKFLCNKKQSLTKDLND